MPELCSFESSPVYESFKGLDSSCDSEKFDPCESRIAALKLCPLNSNWGCMLAFSEASCMVAGEADLKRARLLDRFLIGNFRTLGIVFGTFYAIRKVF